MGVIVNVVIMYVLLNFGDIILGLLLVYGGYLIYGMWINFFGKFYYVIVYEVFKEDYLVDMDVVVEVVCIYWFKMIIVGWLVYLC